MDLGLEYLANPLVDSEEQARQILSSDILIESPSGRFSLGDLAVAPVWSERDRFDVAAPIPFPEPGDGEEHKVLVARIDLSGLDAKSINLRVTKESLQAVIFWVDEPTSESDSVRRVFLIAGDSSMPVDLPPKSRALPGVLVWASAALGVSLVAFGIARVFKKRGGAIEKSP